MEQQPLAKAEWGTKRVCQSCGARFYDLLRTPIVCPACGTTFDVEVLARVRRSRPAARAEVGEALVDEAELAVGAAAVVVGDDAEIEDEAEAAIAEPVEEDEEEDPHLIEDTGDLGDDDVTDVIGEDIDEDPDTTR
jgi:uncharacterized protein (TIGR02300 family)